MKYQYVLESGDTNFLFIVNPDKYITFVDEDWEFKQLFEHVLVQMKENRIAAFQMTNEGIEHSWCIEINDSIIERNYFKKAEFYIEVSNSELYIIEYTSLTMAAQFEKEIVPDEYCKQFRIPLKNGIYKVLARQYRDVDNDIDYGNHGFDLEFSFLEVNELSVKNEELIWFTYEL